MSDINIEFDRNLAGGYAEGDRITIARSPFVDGLLESGVAHEIADDDIDPAELGRRELTKTGNKADLVERLREDDAAREADTTGA